MRQSRLSDQRGETAELAWGPVMHPRLRRRIDIKLDDVGEFGDKAGIAGAPEQGLVRLSNQSLCVTENDLDARLPCAGFQQPFVIRLH